jgi:hypothetical protein
VVVLVDAVLPVEEVDLLLVEDLNLLLALALAPLLVVDLNLVVVETLIRDKLL